MEGEQNVVSVDKETAGSSGPIIGVVVILAIIILGGLYFWGKRVETGVVTDETVMVEDTSDTAAAIESDLNATDVESLDAELNAS